jgi:hypothetical protein
MEKEERTIPASASSGKQKPETEKPEGKEPVRAPRFG